MRLGLSVPIASHCTRRQAFRASVTSAYPKADFYRVRFGLRPSITLPQNGTGSNGAQQTTEERMQKDNHNTHTHRHRRKGHIWAPDSMQPDNNKKRIFSFSISFPTLSFSRAAIIEGLDKSTAGSPSPSVSLALSPGVSSRSKLRCVVGVSLCIAYSNCTAAAHTHTVACAYGIQ